MSWSIVGTLQGTVTTDGSGNGTVDLSSLTLAQNDFVILSLCDGTRTTDRTFTAPTGNNSGSFTIRADLYADDSNDTNLCVTTQKMGATPDTSITVPYIASTSTLVYICRVYRGADATTQLDVSTVTASGIDSDLANPASITPTTSGAKIVTIYAGSQGILTSWGTPGDISNFVQQAGAAKTRLAAGDANWTSGAFDPNAIPTGQSSVNDSWAAVTLALRPGANAYTLTASAGSYTETGSAASLKRGYRVAATAGSYALTGSVLTARLTRRLSASAGSYALNGSVLTAKVARLLAASAGSYTLAGSGANTKAGRSLAAAAGAYSESGSEATFKYGRVMAASAGSYALAGASVVFAKGYYLTAAAGGYALAGASAGLTAARLLSAGAGSYAVTGAAASFARGFYLTASPGTYSLDGTTAQLSRSFVLSVSVGAYTIAGSDAVLTKAGAVLIVALPARRTTHSSAMPGTASSRRITTYSSAKTGTGE